MSSVHAQHAGMRMWCSLRDDAGSKSRDVDAATEETEALRAQLASLREQLEVGAALLLEHACEMSWCRLGGGWNIACCCACHPLREGEACCWAACCWAPFCDGQRKQLLLQHL